MAYKPVLTIDVDWGGATFSFRSPDLAWSKLRHIATSLRTTGVSADDIDRNPPPELTQALTAAFVEGVFAWEGVMGEEAPLACNTPNRRAIPFEDKLQITQLYVAKCNELQEKKVSSASAPTDTTGTGEATENSPSPTKPPADDTPARPEAEE